MPRKWVWLDLKKKMRNFGNTQMRKKWFCSKFGRQIPRLWNEYYCCILDSHVWVIQKKRNKTEQREKQGWWWRRLNAINFLVRESSVVISVYSCTRKWCVSFVILFGFLSLAFSKRSHTRKKKYTKQKNRVYNNK